jgi:hypothetical protein
MALPVISDTDADKALKERRDQLAAEAFQHQRVAIEQRVAFDAAVAAHTTASTPETRAELRSARAALLQTKANIDALIAIATRLDNLADGTVNTATRVRNQAKQATDAAAAINVPDDEPAAEEPK